MPGLSVIVACYSEEKNVGPLCDRLFKALDAAKIESEAIFVDDESEGSDETVRVLTEKQQAHGKERVRIVRRYREQGRGLSSAVVLGFDAAKFDVLLCMDGDLQHEPESVPDVAGPVLSGAADFTVGSRNVEGGGVGFEWALHRRLMSFVATSMACGVALSTDPMSGFFALSRATYSAARAHVNPIGFKIGLELAVRGSVRRSRFQDVAIIFRNRVEGESKLSGKQNIQYIQQLAALYWFQWKVTVVGLVALVGGVVLGIVGVKFANLD